MVQIVGWLLVTAVVGVVLAVELARWRERRDARLVDRRLREEWRAMSEASRATPARKAA